MTAGRRFWAVLASLALSAGPLGLCTGWSATPEARFDCCVQGACGMHGSDSDGHESHGVDQSDADRCCGSAEQRDDPAPSAAAGVSIAAPAVLTTPVPPVFRPAAQRLDTQSLPQRGAPVPRHLLNSVLIV